MLGCDELRREHRLTLLRIVTAPTRALSNLSTCRGDGLAHLPDHHRCEFVLFRLQQMRQPPHPESPLRQRLRRIAAARLVRERELGLDSLRLKRAKAAEQLAGRGIDRLNWHGVALARRNSAAAVSLAVLPNYAIASFASVRASTRAPSTIASGVAYSSGLCETPLRQGMKIIATGAIGAMKLVS